MALLNELIDQLSSSDPVQRQEALSSLVYIALGGYGHLSSFSSHVEQIKENTHFLWTNGLLEPLYKLLVQQIDKKVPESLFDFSKYTVSEEFHDSEQLDRELLSTLTIFYFIVEANRQDASFSFALDVLNPSILQFFIQAIGRLRWGVSGNLPLRNMFLLFWKLLIALFGDPKQMEKIKQYMRKKYNLPEEVDPNEVTASPLDYHAFRKDIVSRYPAYVPPSSTLPDTFENTRSMSHYIEIPRPVHAQTANNTLPAPTVHIATPAPSPPSSPAIAAGQKVKKSVFMTNQSFPFIHPTEDNVPQSIIEASELFADRVRTTPEMVQLWNERDLFMQRERGWVSGVEKDKATPENEKCHEQIVLDRIEKLYVDTISQLNSFILVVLKFLLASMCFTSSEGNSKSTPSLATNCLLTYVVDTYYANHKGSNISYRAKDISLKAVASVLVQLTSWYKISRKYLHFSRNALFLTIYYRCCQI